MHIGGDLILIIPVAGDIVGTGGACMVVVFDAMRENERYTKVRLGWRQTLSAANGRNVQANKLERASKQASKQAKEG
jgi:hypothetical protein